MPVALILPPSLDLLAGMLAILKVGAFYLPLDPEQPPKRIQLCLNDSRAKVLTSRSIGRRLGLSHFILAEKEGSATSFASPATSLEESAYLIYTGGKAGIPKGVEISHGSLLRRLVWLRELIGVSSSDVLLAATTFSSSASTLELLLPLVAQARVVIATAGQARDPWLLARLIETSGCTIFHATPSTWRALLSIGWHPPRTMKALSSGEVLSRKLADRLLALGVELWNLFGADESTGWSLAHRVQPGLGAVPLGMPLGNMSALILDAKHEPLPANLAGDLFLGGSDLASGYRGQPALTSQSFRTLPHSAGIRFYRSGDRAVQREDGVIQYCGRVENRVLIEGRHVELEAIEAAIELHPDIGLAVAKAWPEATGENRLSVYVQATSGKAPSPRALLAFLQQAMPNLPTVQDVVELTSIPLTFDGKLDRNALPRPAHQEVEAFASPAWTPTERSVAGLWTEVLGVPVTDVDADFFDLGGHSLIVARLQHRFTASFGRPVTMAALFHAPTVRRQAALIESLVEAKRPLPSSILTLQPAGTQPSLFWFHPTPFVKNLVTGLGDDQPMIACVLTPEDVDRIGPQPTMEAIAGRHAAAILEAQPHGPFYLGGYCIGGVVAYAVADHLTKAGHEVELVFLLDSQNPVFYRRIDRLSVELSKIQFYLQRALKQGRSATSLRDRISDRLKSMIRSHTAESTEMSSAEQVTRLAASTYRPPPYAGRVLLLQPQERPAKVNYRPGWLTVVQPGLEIQDVPGHHDELLAEQNAHSVAAVIGSHIREQSTRRSQMAFMQDAGQTLEAPLPSTKSPRG